MEQKEKIKLKAVNQKKKTHSNQAGMSSEAKIAMRVSIVSIVINLLLSILKLLAGIIGKSGAMISDAVHSASDVFSTFIVMIGVTVSERKSDQEHPYGHERLECVASIVLAVILAVTGLGIGVAGMKEILGEESSLEIPEAMTLIAAVLSVGIKEWMYWYTRAAAKKINSGALMADAWHHRSDALSSVGAFIGILGARMGFPLLDPVASVGICIFIEKAAYDIFKDAVDKMIDKSCSQDEIDAMKNMILEQAGVDDIDEIKTRLFGAKIYVDVEIAMDGGKTLEEAHAIAEQVHAVMEKEFSQVKHCMVHVNPRKEKGDTREYGEKAEQEDKAECENKTD